MRLLFDVETDGLLEEATRIWCITAIDVDSKEEFQYGPDQIEEGVEFLRRADLLIGHNIQAFDCPVVDKLHGMFWIAPECLEDTLILSKMVYPNLKELDFGKHPSKQKLPAALFGRQSLEAWGYRLGFGKMEKPDFSQYSPRMLEYCLNDSRLNLKLWELLQKKRPPDESVLLEHQIAQICLDQERRGFPFHMERAQELHSRLSARKEELRHELQKTFGPTVVRMKTKTKEVPFNPGSRQQIAERLIARGWKPELQTETGLPKIDESVLEGLKATMPEAGLLAEYFTIDKRLGMLSEGSQGWIGRVGKDGCIHGRVDALGTGTHRASHSNPNMAQVPSCSAPYGKECRSLFYAPEGYDLLGVDVSRLELVMLAHYMNDPAFTDALLHGDVHQVLADAYGTARGPGKNVTYAFIYGAGLEKLGVTADPSLVSKADRVARGKQIQANLATRLPALTKLQAAVKEQARAHKKIRLIDGRYIPVRSEHSALNFLLQGGGAVVCKQWIANFHQALTNLTHYDVHQVAWVHDEIQTLVPKGLGDRIGKLCVSCIEQAGVDLGLKLPVTGEYRYGSSWAETH